MLKRSETFYYVDLGFVFYYYWVIILVGHKYGSGGMETDRQFVNLKDRLFQKKKKKSNISAFDTRR